MAATGAFAQSSVTIYGQADAALTSAKSGANSVTGLFGAGRGSNFVGFMGTEDLGGGLKANFKLEAQYNLDTGAGSSSNTNNQATGGLTTQTGAATAPTLNAAPADRASLAGAQGLTFNRWSYVGLSGGFGEVRLGREYTPTFNAILGADVVGANGAGNTLNMTLMLAGQSANLVANGTSASNGISYETPNTLGGFGVKAQLIRGENPNTGTTTTLNAPNAGDGTSVHGYYNNGPLSAGISALTVKGTRVASDATNGIAGLPGDYKQSASYAKYDFGVALATLGLVEEKLITPASASESVNKSTIFGASVPFGPYKLNANYVTSKYTLGGVDTSKGNQLALQGMYALSKRTDLYATYAVTKNTLGKSYGLGNGAGRMVAVSNNEDKSTGIQIGMRHAF